MAEGVVSDEVDRDGYLGIGNGAALVTNPKNGDILAMVGSRDYFDSDHDGNVNITTSLRQPGSTIKLITYALALSSGFTEATILDDVPLTITTPGSPPYSPVNYDGRFHGKVPLRIAFANSFNIPAVRVANVLGVDKIVSFAKQMGITTWGSPENYGLSITLGAAEVKMTDLATAYGTVANSGERVDLDPILKITDSEGKVIQKKEEAPVRVITPGVAFIISDILADSHARSIEFGTNSPLSIPGKRVSVKTGTTDDKRDNWTIGYTPDVLVATWVGNNDNTPLSQALASGITGAAPMWNRIMTNLLQDKNSAPLIVPDDVVTKKCFGYDAYFIRGTENVPCRIIGPTPTPIQQ
jgi:membrane peptidoglycan carboxypeptidase